jgi:hypothetical protein
MPAREIAFTITADSGQVFDSLLERSLSAGAARGIRTPDPVITNDVLYQLSYCGEPCGKRVHLISGGAPVGKENAGSAMRNRRAFEAYHSLIPMKEARQGKGIRSGRGF